MAWGLNMMPAVAFFKIWSRLREITDGSVGMERHFFRSKAEDYNFEKFNEVACYFTGKVLETATKKNSCLSQKYWELAALTLFAVSRIFRKKIPPSTTLLGFPSSRKLDFVKTVK